MAWLDRAAVTELSTPPDKPKDDAFGSSVLNVFFDEAAYAFLSFRKIQVQALGC